MNLVERAKKIILQPKQEWEAIADEPATVQQIFTGWVMILAAIPSVAAFIGYSVVGIGVFGATYRVPLGAGVAYLVLSYVLALGSVYVLALIIDALAPQFGGDKNFILALKVAAYSPTAYWLAGVFSVIPALQILGLLGLYSLYLLYTGLPILMNAPEEKSVPYTVVVFITVIVLAVVIAIVAGLAIPGPVRGF